MLLSRDVGLFHYFGHFAAPTMASQMSFGSCTPPPPCGTQMAAAFLERLEFDRDRLAAALRHGNVGATLRMEEEVCRGTPLREAHHAVAAEVSEARDEAAPLIDTPLERYCTIGSPHPEEVRRVAGQLLESLGLAEQAR